MNQPDDPVYDFSECANEPIHVPGAIQGHGFYLAIDTRTWNISHVSANAKEWVGRSGEELLGEPLEELVSRNDLAVCVASELQKLTGYDRVMVYRFHVDASGEVIGEAKRDDLSPFLGLHYPESDIPAQARALYLRNRIRSIHDAQYLPIDVIAHAGSTQRPLDMSDAILRSVSPVHCQYLQNMGVKSSMSVSLIVNGHLWGLIACHHYESPWQVPLATRGTAEFLGQSAAMLFSALEDA